MKYTLKSTQSLAEGPLNGQDVCPIELNVLTSDKKYIQNFFYSEVRNGQSWVFLVKIFVTGSHCETDVYVTKFTKKRGIDGSHVTYGGGETLIWNIDVGEDMLYCFADLAADAINFYMKDM
tara:strand:- start:1351 stop:1713 length:363 start_codon:yes stop_codon:yes gene_type:complete